MDLFVLPADRGDLGSGVFNFRPECGIERPEFRSAGANSPTTGPGQLAHLILAPDQSTGNHRLFQVIPKIAEDLRHRRTRKGVKGVRAEAQCHLNRTANGAGVLEEDPQNGQ